MNESTINELSQTSEFANTEAGLKHLLKNACYEMMPTDDVIGLIEASLSKDTLIHMMCPPEQGSDHSVGVCVKLAELGYTNLVPHISSRTVRSKAHLKELIQKLKDNGIRRGFFPGGDGEVPYGDYTSAVELLEDLAELDHGLETIAIGCYPEGHRVIPDDILFKALKRKQKIATHMINEITLDPEVLVYWLRQMRSEGITIPLWVGVPGVMPLSRLMNQIQTWGVKQAIRYVKKSHGIVGALVKGKFKPDTVIHGLAKYATDPELNIQNTHFFTFNEIAKTEQWCSAQLSET